MSGVRSKNPRSRRQLVPHFAVEQANELLLHFTSAVRTDSACWLIIKSLLELGNNFIGRHTAGQSLFL